MTRQARACSSDLRPAGILPDPHRDGAAASAMPARSPQLMGTDVEIVEFGAGGCARCASCWMPRATPRAYTPLDISGDYLREVVRALAADYPALTLRPLVGGFHPCRWRFPPWPAMPRRAGFFPGSTIGNFRPDAAMALLRRMRASLNGGGLLIGVDLVKDPARLHAAYNDAAGVTAAVQQESAGARQSRTGRGFRSRTPSPIMRPTTPRRTASRCIWSASGARA